MVSRFAPVGYPTARPFRRRALAGQVVYRLDVVDARRLHAAACSGDLCWCVDCADDHAFLGALFCRELVPQGFGFGPNGGVRGSVLTLGFGPGLAAMDARPLHRAIAQATHREQPRGRRNGMSAVTTFSVRKPRR